MGTPRNTPRLRQRSGGLHRGDGQRPATLIGQRAKEGTVDCIAPGDQDDVPVFFAKQVHAATDGGQVAIGRPHPGAGGVVPSYEEALNALDLVARLNLDEPVPRAADLRMYPVLSRDRQAMADLVRNTLGPLETARGGAQSFGDTLTAYVDSGASRPRRRAV